MGIAAALLLGAQAASSCGGGSGGPIPIGQLGAQYAAAFCHKVFTCCEASERSTINADDEATCRTLVATDVNANIAKSQASIDAGRVVYHGDLARRCFDTLTALSCAQWGGDDQLRRFSECLHVLEGTIPPGNACTASAECKDGSCDVTPGAGICVARAGLGGACPAGLCLAELACQFETSICINPQPDGSACTYAAECASGFCEADATGAFFCGPPTTCNGI